MRIENKPSIIAIDSETFYTDECSVVVLGNWHYVRHPDFYCYMISAKWDGGEWSGKPEEFDWEAADGAIWVMANAAFDLAVIVRMQELGLIPASAPSGVRDVLDLTAYLGYPRSLESASEHLLKRAAAKTVRNAMKGKHYRDLTGEQQQRMLDYAKGDAVNTFDIFMGHGHKMPDWEWRVSNETREMCERGLPMDAELVGKNIQILEMALWKARKTIPWAANDEDAKALSPKLLAIECRKAGIEPPVSMAKDSEEFEEWLEEYSERFPFVRAMSDFRRINSILEKLKTMRDRIRPDGWMPYSLLYFGAHTGRDSAQGGFNPLNLPKFPFFLDEKHLLISDKTRLIELQKAEKKGVYPDYAVYRIDLRNCIKAPPGKVLIPVDAAQIEARVTLGLVRDEEQLQKVREGMSVYEVHARDTMGYSDPEPLKIKDALKYHTSKTRVLGLGFACGFFKFVSFAKGMLPLDVFEQIFGHEVSESEIDALKVAIAKRSDDQGKELQKKLPHLDETTLRYWVNSFLQVNDFRARNKKIADMWKHLKDAMSMRRGQDFEIELPSGRKLRYRDVRNMGGTSAIIPRKGKMMRCFTHGGKLLENAAQGAARDIFMDRVLEMRSRGHQVILRVYDEALILADAEGAEDTLKELEEIMSTSPSWWPTLPLGAEGAILERYTK